MPKDHYLPAAYLGRFSFENSPAARERKLWVLRRNKRQAAPMRAERIAAVNNLYSNEWFESIDSIWTLYEMRLKDALDALTVRPPELLDAQTWLRVLVPFVAGIFVRGPSFDASFKARPVVEAAAKIFGNDRSWENNNTNGARLIELQGILAPIMAAEWTVLHCHGEPDVLVNDLGYVNHTLIGAERSGWAFPIDERTLLSIQPIPKGKARKALLDVGHGEWRALIDHVDLKRGEHAGFNRWSAIACREFIAGKDRETVERYADIMKGPGNARAANTATLPPMRVRHAHGLMWHELVSAIKYSAKDERIHTSKLDPAEIARDWHSTFVWYMNRQLYYRGFEVRGRSIQLSIMEDEKQLALDEANCSDPV